MKATPLDVSVVKKLEMLSEIRSIAELMRYLALSERALITSAPPGDGRPILVIPGFLCNDTATWALRRFLRAIGYRSFRWKQGVNWGPRPGVRTRVLHRLNELRVRYAQPVTIIGWSLGGLYAREISNIRPDLVREVITLGSPLQGVPQSTAVWRLFDWINREHLRDQSSSTLELCRQVETPSLSIFSRGDGIVPWPMCMPVRGHHAHYWEVRGSHIGLIYSPEVMHVLASHLAESRAGRSLQLRTRKNRRKIARAVKAEGASPPLVVPARSRWQTFLVSAEALWKAASGWAPVAERARGIAGVGRTAAVDRLVAGLKSASPAYGNSLPRR